MRGRVGVRVRVRVRIRVRVRVRVRIRVRVSVRVSHPALRARPGSPCVPAPRSPGEGVRLG